MNADRKNLADSRYAQIMEAVRKDGSTSIAHLQDKCNCAYNGALYFLERLENEGVIGKPDESGVYLLVTP